MQHTGISPFVQAMDKATDTSQLCRGENGAAEHTAKGVEESRVALFFALVRDLPKDRFDDLFRLVLADASPDHPEVVADLFLLAFQTRNCRGGKGEKDLFYRMIMELSVSYPRTVESLMTLVPHYGSYRDWFKLVSLAKHDDVEPRIQLAMIPIVNAIIDLAAEQLLRDKQALEELTMLQSRSAIGEDKRQKGTNTSATTQMISLLAKWAPREKKQFGKQVRILANKLFPDSKAPKKEYRQLLARLNKAIQTVEVYMSANQYDAIDPVRIPSNCMMKHRKAFLNEKVKGPPPYDHEMETGNRSEDASRIECRKRLRQAMLDTAVKKLKGRQLFPHEIVEKMMNDYNSTISQAEEEVFNCQWEDIVENVRGAMKAAKEKGSQESLDGDDSPGSGCIDLGKIVPLVDVSGSMYGTPIKVAMALGILISEIACPEFAHRCVTFHSDPSWVQFDPSMSLMKKVRKLKNSPWGMNTDFERAMEMILEIAVEAKLEPEDIPDLIVFSDMQFDEAKSSRGSWETHHQRIVRRFKEEGQRVCGKEWPAPHIVYWNLSGRTVGFPAQGDTPNVTMLSGFSPSLMKLLLNGDPVVGEEEEEETVVLGDDGEEVVRKIKTQKTPYTTVRKALDDEDYNLVRRILSKSVEGLLQFYKPPDDSIIDPMEGIKDQSEEVDKSPDDWELVK